MKPVNSEKTVPGGLSGDDCGRPGLPGYGGVPEARVPLRELMDGRLLDALLERSAGGGRGTGVAGRVMRPAA